jgi:hypothetical protein
LHALAKVFYTAIPTLLDSHAKNCRSAADAEVATLTVGLKKDLEGIGIGDYDAESKKKYHTKLKKLSGELVKKINAGLGLEKKIGSPSSEGDKSNACDGIAELSMLIREARAAVNSFVVLSVLINPKKDGDAKAKCQADIRTVLDASADVTLPEALLKEAVDFSGWEPKKHEGPTSDAGSQPRKRRRVA